MVWTSNGPSQSMSSSMSSACTSWAYLKLGTRSHTAASAALIAEAATETLQGQSLHDSFPLSQSLSRLLYKL